MLILYTLTINMCNINIFIVNKITSYLRGGKNMKIITSTTKVGTGIQPRGNCCFGKLIC